MKLLSLLLVTFAISACADMNKDKLPVEDMPGIAKQQYVPGTEDIPLFFGFDFIEDQELSYDSYDGRIIDAEFYSKTADASNVRKFYEETLPQLGWSKRQYQIYERDGEILKLNILQQNNGTILKFKIRPRA